MADKADKTPTLYAQRDFMHKGERVKAGTAAGSIDGLSASDKSFLEGNGCFGADKPAGKAKADDKLPGV